MSTSLSLGSIKEKAMGTLSVARKYAVVLFLLFFVAIYGFLAWRTLTLSQAEPDPSALTTELQTAGVPKIDQDVLNKIQQLQDNSVSVQTLFDEARSNPFQEQ